MSTITKEDLNHIAKLSNLPLRDGEDEVFSQLLSDTISYVKVLEELDTSNVNETYQVTGLVNVYQKEDENVATLSQEDALKNANSVEKGLMVTKGVFDRS